jgi:hypothetical protein
MGRLRVGCPPAVARRHRRQLTASHPNPGDPPGQVIGGLLSAGLQSKVMQPSPYSQNLSGISWSKWESYKHLVHVVASATEPLAQMVDARQAMKAAVASLVSANALHASIRTAGVQLRDKTDTYQSPWAAAGTRMLAQNTDDYDWLELMGGP